MWFSPGLPKRQIRAGQRILLHGSTLSMQIINVACSHRQPFLTSYAGNDRSHPLVHFSAVVSLCLLTSRRLDRGGGIT